MKTLRRLFSKKDGIQRVSYSDSALPLLVRSVSYMRTLSSEVLVHILRFLTQEELCMIAAVSKAFRDCALDKTLWRAVSFDQGLSKVRLMGAINMLEKTDMFSNVRIVNINNESITSSMVEQIIQSTPNLKEIKFNNLKVTEKMTKLLVSKCPSLEQVCMEGGRTDDECLELLAHGAIKLKAINLHKVRNITTTGICHVIKNTNLAFLNFNGISGWDIRSLAPYCAHFTSMDLGCSNNLVDGDLKSLTQNSTRLAYLSLKNCKMITDISMKELVLDCPQLSELNMTGCEKMTATSVQFALQNFHHLNSLCLAAFSGLSPIPFPRFPYRVMVSMMNLDVSFTNVDDEDFHNLSEFCPNLYSLKMIGCVRITDDGLLHIARKCNKMVFLDASRDQSVPHRMPISIASVGEFAMIPSMIKMCLSYSNRNKINKRSLIELNDLRLERGLKAMSFHLNDTSMGRGFAGSVTSSAGAAGS